MFKRTFNNIYSFFRTNRIGVILAATLALLYGIQITYGLPNRNVTWPADGDPLMTLIFAKRALLDGWNTGWHTPYPDFHRFVLLMFETPYMALQYALGNLAGMEMDGGYPYGVERFDTIFMHLAMITRAVSIGMALGAVYFTVRIAKTLFPDQPAVFAGAIIGFSPAIVYYVHTETLDVPMLFWLSAALYCYVRVLKTFQLRYYIWLAVLAAVSTATKDYAYGAFVLMPLPLVWRLARKDGQSVTARTLLRSVIDRRHLIALVVFVVAFVFAENLIWNPSGFANHVRLAAGLDNGPTTITTDTGRLLRLEGLLDGRLSQLGRTMPFVLGWVGLPVCIIGMLFVGVCRTHVLASLLWPMTSYLLFTVVLLPAEGSIERPFIPIGLLMAVFGGQLLAALWSTQNGGPIPKCACLLLLLAMAASGFAMDLMLKNDTRYKTEQWFADNVPENASVELYGYRRHCPRIYTCWEGRIVNQDESPSESDMRITGEEFLFGGLKERAPELIVVTESYAQTWKKGKQRHDKLAPACRDFFRSLEKGKLDYRRVAHFDPYLGFMFGMPEQRRLVPAITIYERHPDESGEG